MKTKSILALSIILLILSLTKSFAATYTFTGTGDWSDVALWDTYPGITINSGDMVVISTGSQCLLEGSLANNGTIENHGRMSCWNFNNTGIVYNYLNATLTVTMDLVNNGTILNNASMIIADLRNYKSLKNTGSVTISSSFINTDTILNNGYAMIEGAIYNNGIITNNDSLIIENIFTNDSTIENHGYASFFGFDNLGTITNHLNAKLISNMDFNNGTLNNQGLCTLMNFENNGFLNNNGSMIISDLNNKKSFNNTGSVTVSSNFSNTGTIANDGYAMIENEYLFPNNNGLIINNDSLYIHDFTNDSTIQNYGLIVCPMGFMNNGIINNHLNAKFEVNMMITNNDTIINDGSMYYYDFYNNQSFNNNGSVAISSSFNNTGTITNDGYVMIQNGSTVNSNKGKIINNDSLFILNTFTNDSTIDNHGYANFFDFQNNGTINNSLNAKLFSLMGFNNGTLNNNGILESTNFANVWILNNNASIMFVELGNAKYFNNNGVSIISVIYNELGGLMVNDGLVTVSGNRWNSYNKGVMINNDSLLFESGFENDSVFYNNGYFNCYMLINNGVFNSSNLLSNNHLWSGNGEIIADFANDGIISPGNSPGKQIINGDYTQTGTYELEINGTDGGAAANGHDLIVVSGVANLSGILNVVLLNGFVPALGDRFTIMTFESRQDVFETVNLPNISPNEWFVNYMDTKVILEVRPESTKDIISACESYTWIDGVTYTASNNNATHTLISSLGADSLVTLNLTINHPTFGTDSHTACESYTWIDGVTYTASNSSATHRLTNSLGCDSVVTLNLTINHPTTGTDFHTACESYTWIDGVTYTASSSSATHTLTNSLGCDSVVTLNLTINHPTTGTDSHTACESYTWIDGVTYMASSSSATHTLTNSLGCDSVVTLNLTINHPTTGTDSHTACESYTWIDGVTYTASNSSATHTLTNSMGCDSVVTLNLTINHPTTGTDSHTACESYTWIDGITYTASNSSATHTLTNSMGCDSVVTLNLTINHPTFGTDSHTACESYTWIDGVTYTASTSSATHTLMNSLGCDSVVTLNLTINHPTTGTDSHTACESYTWIDGITYTASNSSATHTLMNSLGCDSVVTLNLTINHPTFGTDFHTACESYTWIDGVTYTASTSSATHTLTNSLGCDSVVTLNLTINHPTFGTDSHTACESYTWIDGITYTANNSSATHTLTNSLGCDSVVTLNLTINHPTTGTDSHTACESYTWIDGVTYTANNSSATHRLTNSMGCDSVVTLNLTINTIDVSTALANATITANTNGVSYQWLDCNNLYAAISGETNQSFTATSNGNYAVKLTQNGCTDTSACVNISDVGVESNPFVNNIRLFPNPTNKIVNIGFGNEYKEICLIIRDINGKVVEKFNYSNAENISCEIVGVPGFYLLEVTTPIQKMFFKVIKQ